MSLQYLQTVPDASEGICGPAGTISLSAVFSSLVSPMGTTDVTGRRIGDMRSDGVHGSLKTTGMTTVPQFQLGGTSSGRLSFPDSAGWPLLIAPSRVLCRFVVYPVNPAMDLVGSREGSPVRRL